jgi:hypothetical protein
MLSDEELLERDELRHQRNARACDQHLAIDVI